jgi:glycosyltransferase involved in cell wall biosynthesis
MATLFDTDIYPGRPRILFIGPGESTHTHSWVDLLENEPFNVRLYVLPGHYAPPDDWKVKTYITDYHSGPIDRATRNRFIDKSRLRRQVDRFLAIARGVTWNTSRYPEQWLAGVIRSWRPHIIHTFSLDAAMFYFDVRKAYDFGHTGKWVLQARGGADLAWSHLDPELRPRIGEVLRACDQFLSDNTQNFRIARELGVREEQLSSMGTVPGTGGIDLKVLSARWQGKTSTRRVILWPKVYEWPWSKALPIYEALKLAWDRIQPCEVEMLATTPEARMYFWTLPEHMREACRLRERVPRSEALDAMTRARVMLAPSLVDGTPNSMFEAMAAGALPIVSPLETIRPLVKDEHNVLFARNLYPDEIAAALVRAMTDDRLVDQAAQRNLELVSLIANRDEVRTRVVKFYQSLADESQLHINQLETNQFTQSRTARRLSNVDNSSL